MSNKKNNSIKFVKIILLLFIAIFVLTMTYCKKPNNNNIVIIVIDTLRSDHLPFYKYKKNTAPFLNKISKESFVFNNCYSASSWTAPATASIFTSMYPFQHGVYMGLLAIINMRKEKPTIKINKIPKNITTITETLKQNGYKTFGFSDNANIDKKEGFHQGFDLLNTNNYVGAEEINKIILNKKNTILSNKQKYFLYIHYMDPHAPYHKRKPWYDNKKNGKVPISVSAYDSEISFVDKHIKELYKEFGWNKNTILIITADHGEGLWDHGTMGHGLTLHREEIQVPLIIKLPNNKKEQRIGVNVSTIDILPTVCELIGLSKNKYVTGKSLVPLMMKRENKLSNRFLFSHLLKINKGKRIEFNSVIYKKWHFLFSSNGDYKLYKMLTDIKENKNEFKSKKGKEIAKKFLYKLKKFKKTCKKFATKSSTVIISKKDNEKLKTLGYINTESKN